MDAILRRAILVPLVLATACAGPGAVTAEQTVTDFVRAVQAQDVERLYCLVAGASESPSAGQDPQELRAGFEDWARERFQAYLDGRDRGWVELDDHGLTLVRLFALGKGAFYDFAGKRFVDDEVLLVETVVRFGYAHIDLSRFSPGTTLYVCGVPVGRVHPIRVPAGSEEMTVEALNSVRIRWTLVRGPAGGGCAGGWTVATATAVEGSEISTQVTWVF